MVETEYWVYKAELGSEQARVVGRFNNEDAAYDWADEEFDEPVTVLQETEGLPRPMNSDAFVVEVVHETNNPVTDNVEVSDNGE